MIEYTNSEISSAIDEHIHSERDRNLLKDRLINGMRYEPLAEKYELSVAQVKRIVYKEQSKLFKLIS